MLACLMLAALRLGAPATVRADDASEPDGYRVAIREALAERELGHYQESRALFAKAHALLPSARTLRGLGLSDYDLRNYPACVRNLEAALASPVRPLDGALRAEVEDVLAHAYNFVGRYNITLEPAAARLAIDDVDQWPFGEDATTIVAVGEHTLRVTADGYQTLQTRLRASGGEHEQLSFALVPALAAPIEPARAAESERRPWYKRAWVWTAVGVVLAGAATGIAIATTRSADAAPAYYGGTSLVVIDAR